MTWSAFGQIHLVQKQADVQESLGPILAEHNWPATSFHFQTQLHSSTDDPDHIVQNQPRSDLVLAVSGFGQMDPVQEKASGQESSDPLLANASEPIWIRYKLDPACLLG